MIKYFIRKTIFKNLDRETQDVLLELNYQYFLIEVLCYVLFVTFCISPLIPLFIIDISEDIEFSVVTQIIVFSFIILLYFGIFTSIIIFQRATRIFFEMMIERLYFLLCTQKGKALSKKDFETIEQVDTDLNFLISTQSCKGYCFSVCFDMCKILKKGDIEFIAIKKTSIDKDSKNYDGKSFFIHVIYINNEWTFDTNSAHQYPIDELHRIYKAKIYKKYNFDDISTKSYEDFKNEIYPELSNWCSNNDCSCFSDKK